MQTVQCRVVLVSIDVLTAPGASVTVARLALGSAHSAIAVRTPSCACARVLGAPSMASCVCCLLTLCEVLIC